MNLFQNNINKRLECQFIFIMMISLSFGSYSFSRTSQQQNHWASWRGPNGNGAIDYPELQSDKFFDDISILWKDNIGCGHSAIAVKDNRAYLFGNQFEFFKMIVLILIALNVFMQRQVKKYGNISIPVKHVNGLGQSLRLLLMRTEFIF